MCVHRSECRTRLLCVRFQLEAERRLPAVLACFAQPSKVSCYLLIRLPASLTIRLQVEKKHTVMDCGRCEDSRGNMDTRGKERGATGLAKLPHLVPKQAVELLKRFVALLHGALLALLHGALLLCSLAVAFRGAGQLRKVDVPALSQQQPGFFQPICLLHSLLDFRLLATLFVRTSGRW